MRVACESKRRTNSRPGDLRVKVDRRTAHYREPVLLAITIIQSLGRTPLAGGHIGWTFLIRTPETVEDALRTASVEALPAASVDKTRLQLPGTSLTLNPDLVFSAPAAVGEVKYKLSPGEWIRTDLYQLVAFATGFRVSACSASSIPGAAVSACRDLTVGNVHVSERTWPADPLIPAATAAVQFVGGVRDWIASCTLPA